MHTWVENFFLIKLYAINFVFFVVSRTFFCLLISNRFCHSENHWCQKTLTFLIYRLRGDSERFQHWLIHDLIISRWLIYYYELLITSDLKFPIQWLAILFNGCFSTVKLSGCQNFHWVKFLLSYEKKHPWFHWRHFWKNSLFIVTRPHQKESFVSDQVLSYRLVAWFFREDQVCNVRFCQSWFGRLFQGNIFPNNDV